MQLGMLCEQWSNTRVPERNPQTLRNDGESSALIENIRDFDAIFFITKYGINPYSYSGFLWATCSPLGYWIKGRAFGHRTSLDRRRHLAWQLGDVIQVWLNSSPPKSLYFSFQSTVSAIIFIQHLKCTYWIKGILCGYVIRSGRHPSVGPTAADFPRDVCLTVSRNHKVFLLYRYHGGH